MWTLKSVQRWAKSWSQCTGIQPAGEVIHPAVGCHYFPPCLQWASQPQSITATWPVNVILVLFLQSRLSWLINKDWLLRVPFSATTQLGNIKAIKHVKSGRHVPTDSLLRGPSTTRTHAKRKQIRTKQNMYVCTACDHKTYQLTGTVTTNDT